MLNNIDMIQNKLKDFGYKLTPQRILIAEILKEHEGEHLSIEEIHDVAKVDNPDIGIATIYRTVNVLIKIGLVLKIDFDDGFSRYEFKNDTEKHVHHHLVCLSCGLIKGIDDDLLGDVEKKISKKENFIIKDHMVKFYGFCEKCKGKY